MWLKNVNILKCSEGDILASDVYSRNGMTLVVAKDTMLNEYIRNRLIEMGIGRVCIYEDQEQTLEPGEVKKTYKRTVELTRNLFQDLISGRPMDYKKIAVIGDQIMKCIHHNGNITECLAQIRRKDEYTYSHSVNVAFYAMLIAKWMNLSKDEIYKAILSGLLHDIGKVKIPKPILSKTGRLTTEEFDIIKNHTIFGYEIVKQSKELDPDIKRAILLHHERMDGSGYPYSYEPDHLNLFSRIVAIADVFDAMTSERVYKGRSTPFEAFQMFLTTGMSTFDVRILNVFIKNMVNYLVGSQVQLSNGETGTIVFIPQNDLFSPVVNVSNKYIDLSDESDIKIVKMI